MSETNRRWRCPYCDGLNDWQNVVCEICGDGRRDETEPAPKPEKAVEPPKTYTPQPGKPVKEAPRSEAKVEKEATYAPPPPPPAPEPKRKRGKGIIIAVVVVALAALGGRYMGDSFVKHVEANGPTATPLAVIETVAPKAQPTDAPAPKATEPPAQTTDGRVIAVFDAPDSPVASIQSIIDNGDGTARVVLQGNGCKEELFTVGYYFLASPADDVSDEWYLNEAGNARCRDTYPYSLAENTIQAIDVPVTVQVFPGHWMQFVVRGRQKESGHGSKDWLAKPGFVPLYLNPSTPPARFVEARHGVWANEQRTQMDFLDIATSRKMNDTLDNYESIRLWTRYFFKSDEGLSAREIEEWSKEHYTDYGRCTFVLYAPGFCEISPRFSFWPSSDGNGSICINTPAMFSPTTRINRKDIGGYPAGQYTMECFINGVSVGSYSFALK